MNNSKKSNNLIQEVLLLLKPMGDVDYLIATDAIGSENVRVVFMPTTFTSKESEIDSIHLYKKNRSKN